MSHVLIMCGILMFNKPAISFKTFNGSNKCS